VTLVEWADRLADAMPDERLDVLIDGSGDDPRTITLRPGHASYARYLELVPEGAEDGDAGHDLAVVADGATHETEAAR
jgi:hypothetical protein